MRSAKSLKRADVLLVNGRGAFTLLSLTFQEISLPEKLPVDIHSTDGACEAHHRETLA
jgi:hypothetical protein